MELSKSLLVIKADRALSREHHELLKKMVAPIAERCGCEVLVADECLDVGIHSDIKPLIEQQLIEQRKTNELLMTLIEALSEDQDIDEDQQPVRHLDGTLA